MRPLAMFCGSGRNRCVVPASPHHAPLQPEFLFSEEALVHKRSWSENLTYYTGVGYLAGAARCAVPRVLRPPPVVMAPVLQMGAPPRSHWQLTSAPVAGALLGGGRGAAQALTAPVALAGVESSQRLRVNQLLNTSGKMGRSAGRGPDWI